MNSTTAPDPARAAAVGAAIDLVKPGMVLGLGSGRAAFALTAAIGARWNNGELRVVTASKATSELALSVGLEIVEINEVETLDVVFDGADEIDEQLRLIKGAGAALLREKLVLAAASHAVILAEEPKLVKRLGTTRALPVEIVPFAWSHTLDRLIDIAGTADLWTDEFGEPFLTDNGNHLVDVLIPPTADLVDFAQRLKSTLGVVEHGLFLNQTSEAIIGRPDGSLIRIDRRDLR